MRVVAIVNQKGGCGKTTTAINLAAILASRGKRTLLVDLDPQSHCAAGLGVPEDRIDRSIGNLLLSDLEKPVDTASFIWEVSRNLDLIPSVMELAAVEAPGGGLHQLPDKDRRLARLLEHLQGAYDCCIIDCPPTIGLLTFNALRAAGEALIPVETSFFALRGAKKQWITIRKLVDRLDRPFTCHVLPTLHKQHARLSKDILGAIERHFAGAVVPVVIREHEAFREAASFGQPIIEYSPKSVAVEDFKALADWFEETAEPTPMIEVESKIADLVLEPDRPTEPPREPPETKDDGSRAAEIARRVRTLSDQIRRPEPPPPPTLATATGAVRPEPLQKGGGITTVPMPQVQPGATRPPVRLYGVRQTRQGVLFVQPGLPDQRVCVAGDFNNWSATATPLRYNAEVGVFEGLVDVPAGRFEYRLIIDGEWQPDPYNRLRARNDFGIDNNVFLVQQGEQHV